MRSPPLHLDASNFGVVPGAAADNTAPLQAALNAAAEAGAAVWLPPGEYRIDGVLSVPPGAALRGAACAPASWRGGGSVLLAHAGRGREDGPPFITLRENAVLAGVTVYYPEQDAARPVPYPWCIAGDGENVSILDSLLVNPWQAIDLGARPCPRHLVRGVNGQPLRRGLFVDQCFDIGRIENVHFWPFWKEGRGHAAVRDFLQSEGEAFIFAMTDWQYVQNTFCWGYRTGYRFTENGRGVCNGNFSGIGADACNVCIQIDNCAAYGLLITNGEFVAIYGENPTPIVTGPECTGTVQFNNCAFWGPCHQGARLEGRGFVSMSQCHFLEWDPRRTGVPCVDARAGSIIVQGSRFAKAAEAVRVGPDVRGAVVSGNLFARADALRMPPGPHTAGTNAVEAAPAPPRDGAVVVSVLGPHVHITGDWWDYAGRGTYAGVAYFCADPASAVFRWGLAEAPPGRHTLAAWMPRWVAPVSGQGRARYRIRHAEGETSVELGQAAHNEVWAPLGVFSFDAQSEVALESGGEGPVLADALLLTRAV